MLLVHSDDLGAVGYARALREGVLVPLTATISAPVDVPLTPGLRASALRPLVPQGATVTALAGLWVDGLAPFPDSLDVLRRSGTHRAPRRLQTRSRIVIHAGDPGPGPTREVDSLQIASLERCAVDALRWAPLGPSLTAIWHGLRAQSISTEGVLRALRATPADRSRRRAYDAWNALAECWDASADPTPLRSAA